MTEVKKNQPVLSDTKQMETQFINGRIFTDFLDKEQQLPDRSCTD